MKNRNYSNLGKGLEDTILYASNQYKQRGIARIDKIDTPKVVAKNYSYYKQKSILDFIGTAKALQGKLIAFDAKETENTEGFPLKNVKEHQIKIMQEYTVMGGIAFLIIHFSKLNRYYRLDADTLMRYWNNWKENKRKRGFNIIPLEEFEKNQTLIKSNGGIILDYLKGLK